jgi:thiamine kinase-like enzyme
MVYFVDEYKVISRCRDSVVLDAKLKDGSRVAIKSYKPNNYVDGKDLSLPKVAIEEGYRRSSEYLFEKNRQISELLCQDFAQGNKGCLTPQYLDSSKMKREIVSSYVDKPCYQAKFLEVQEDSASQSRLQQKLLQHVSHFHQTVNSPEVQNYLLNRKIKLKKKYVPLISLREEEEERARLVYSIRLMVYTYSQDFRSSLKLDERDEHYPWNKIRYKVDDFLRDKNLDIHSFVNEFLELHYYSLYGQKPFEESNFSNLIDSGEISVVHGDLGPQNVFYKQRSLGEIIDFDETRLGPREIDLATSLTHAVNNPSEEKMLRWSETYFNDMREQGQNISWEESFSKLIDTRLMTFFSHVGSDCRMSRMELKKFAGLKSPRRHTTTLRKVNFEKAKDFLDFYLRGEGFDALRESNRANFVMDELNRVYHLFDIIDPKAPSKIVRIVRKLQKK